METIEAIFTRRSVRKFEKRQIPETVLTEIISASTYAPSGLNLQPWGFVVVQDQALLTRVSDYCKPLLLELMKDVHEGTSDAFRSLLESKESTIYYNAPTVILVIGKTDSQFRWIDCCLCAENLMLAAHALGIGSCWIGSIEPVYDNEELMAEFHIPDGYSPIGTIAFGYPAEKPVAPDKKSPQIIWIR